VAALQSVVAPMKGEFEGTARYTYQSGVPFLPNNNGTIGIQMNWDAFGDTYRSLIHAGGLSSTFLPTERPALANCCTSSVALEDRPTSQAAAGGGR
jgi:hypothetical protein